MSSSLRTLRPGKPPRFYPHSALDPTAMYASTFIFKAGQYDEEFHRLDAQIAEVARSIPGYRGEETWENTGAGLIQNVYYWETEEALLQLIKHPAHIEAKAKQSRWLDGYRVVIAQVLREYGDGALPMRAIATGQAS
jgi:heme-degrading monooxygenase HmoA